MLGWQNKQCYLKLFYNFFASNLLKLLEKVKPTKSFDKFWRGTPF